LDVNRVWNLGWRGIASLFIEELKKLGNCCHLTVCFEEPARAFARQGYLSISAVLLFDVWLMKLRKKGWRNRLFTSQFNKKVILK
tara:strand:+ start:165876 stop:166130 length:255 start_codon:yes stop_codon:yes gene_type:complete